MDHSSKRGHNTATRAGVLVETGRHKSSNHMHPLDYFSRSFKKKRMQATLARLLQHYGGSAQRTRRGCEYRSTRGRGRTAATALAPPAPAGASCARHNTSHRRISTTSTTGAHRRVARGARSGCGGPPNGKTGRWKHRAEAGLY